MRSSTAVCSNCAGARWVCVDDPTEPWHRDFASLTGPQPLFAARAAGCGQGKTGTPCPACNHGPDFHAWHPVCLRCATLEEFMSTIDPDDEDGALAGLFEQLGDLTMPDDVVDFTQLSDVQVSERFNEVRDRLNELDQMHSDTGLSKIESTPEGRALHSERAALLVEMSKRGMR